jgi:hypothetical protein
MSTSYYWKQPAIPSVVAPTYTLPDGTVIRASIVWPDMNSPQIHIGKSANGRFHWASKMEHVREACARLTTEKVIVCEYGVEFTGPEFLADIAGETDILSTVGDWFC